MYLNKEEKEKLFKNHGRLKKNNDTGSSESQIALFTYRIKHLTDHLQSNKKDHSTRMGLLRLVGKRRKLLNYLSSKYIDRYRAIISELNIRK
tara:strand:+ start:126 stop:401 length:276 start_codon:yes stop_codon:yes gene_type:complete